jgi:hypothetical protein
MAEKIPFWSNVCRTNGWPSSSKLLSVWGGFAGLFVVMVCTWRGDVPEHLPELVGWVLAALVLNKGASKVVNMLAEKKEKEEHGV